jgi:prepilin-type N-terminal cleavage/methylation domain-containing protein
MKTTPESPTLTRRLGRAARIVRSRQGFSLAELMVTLVVSSLLVTGIVGGYIVQKRSYEGEAGMIDMNLNGRLAMNRAAEIIRNAGLGCKDNFPPKNNEVVEGAFNNYNKVFTAVDRSDGPDRLTVVSGLRRRTVVELLGTDHVVVEEIKNPNDVNYFDLDKNRYIFFSPQAENKFLEVKAVDEVTREVKLSEPCTTLDNEFCSIREGDNVFRVNAYTITLDQNGSEIIDVDDDGTVADRDSDPSPGTPDLYIYSNTTDLIPDFEIASAGQANVSTAEVAEGIEALQFRFGWDANDDGEIEDAEFVDDPTGFEADVRAVRIYILSRTLTPDPGFTDPNSSYPIANQTLTLTDDERKYHRQLFVETVMVRNMNL